MPEIPHDFAEALQAAGLTAFFADCTAAHQREYLKWIGEAKQPATRSKRIGQAVTMLAAKQRQESSRPARPKVKSSR